MVAAVDVPDSYEVELMSGDDHTDGFSYTCKLTRDGSEVDVDISDLFSDFQSALASRIQQSVDKTQ